MAEYRPVILIVEDDLDVADMLNAYFNVQGYEVQTANWGEDGVRACQANAPNLVILDIRLPDIDGYEVARRLRRNRKTQHVPIIFLTERRGRWDRLQGLELGADDYITKPFDVQELRLRVRNALRRSSQGTVNNPVTNLPEGILVDQRLEECVASQEWAILLISLQNLENFRDVYGFVASDDVLRAVSLMINNAVRDLGSPSDFIGHYSPTEFVLVTQPGSLAALSERLQSRLGSSLDYFYPLKDQEKGIEPRDRLSVRLKTLSASDGPFKDLETLKARISQIFNSRN